MNVESAVALVRSKVDQGVATMRDWAEKQGADAFASYGEMLCQEMASADPAEALRAHFAMLGYSVVLLTMPDVLVESAKDAEKEGG